ncbi:MAG: thiamine pyrophosphate-binding protein [Nitrospinota bacterium]|nr:MAG: thiamine pyrophosphate-binding protein [Nitrospinota bacterium]
MSLRPITANPSQIMIEQLVALGVKYVFYNSGSREAHFFDALHAHPQIHGILGLHEGSVTAMAGGYAQAGLAPAVMVVHLGAGLAQCLGQLINVWSGSLPVVVITFAGDTGSYADRIGLDLSHNVGPTFIAAPFTKANWTVIEPEGLPQAIYRALLVAKTPPVGPVHLAVYDRLLGTQPVTTSIIEGGLPDVRAGYPDEADLEEVIRVLHDAERPLLYVGDGVWKSGAEAQAKTLAEHFGLPVVGGWGEMRSVPIKHPLHCGRIDQAIATLNPDCILCIGVRHRGRGRPQDFQVFSTARRVIAIGADMENLKNIPGLDLAILADERRTLERLIELSQGHTASQRFARRHAWALEQAATLREQRRKAAQQVAPHASHVRPWVLADALDKALERCGGGWVMIEQFALAQDSLEAAPDGGRNVYMRAAGGSEGYGIGGTIGLKLALPSRPVVGLVGDGSLCFADSGLWSAAHHGIPVLYVIPNNRSYGIVAGFFGQAEGKMKERGEYDGVVLDGIDPVKIAEGFGIEGRQVQEEALLEEALAQGLKVVEEEQRPFLLNVQLPLGLPPGGRPATPFRLAATLGKATAV